ncbi:MAG: heavy metal translocating P-type ATPase [Treponema sp.]|nr:heavy metal translocating P-type ATPase [Treponema sp.]
MKVYVRHSLPGRLRLGYNRFSLTARQATLAQTLIAVQQGIIEITVNPSVGSFLIYYDVNQITVKEILNLFRALTAKYLDDESLLEAVAIVPQSQSILGVFVDTLVGVFFRSFLPLPIRHLILYKNILPRIFKAVKSAANGKVFSTDLLDATALTVSVLTGNYSTASSVSVLLTMGEEMEEITRRQSYDNLAKTLLISNENVHVLVGDEEKTIAPSALKKDDLIIVRSGSQIPADGTVERGEGMVNQASITGESLPVEKKIASNVFAGTMLEEGELVIRVRSTGTDTKVHNIINMIDQSQSLKAQAEKKSEQFAEKIVPFNFLIAGLTYLFTGNVTKTISTLMVDYSCAMKLAAPISVLSAMKEAAMHGISVKGGKFLEEVAHADTVIFDKTGTLTYANPVLTDVYPIESSMSEDDVLLLAACLEEHFPHPLGRAVVKAAEDKNLSHPEKHAKVEYIVSHGIASTLDEKRICIGSAHFIFDDEKIPFEDAAKAIQKQSIETGHSLLYMSVDGKLAAILAIGDPVRPDARHAVACLKRSGINRCIMVTGDTEGAAQKIANDVGLDAFYAQALPEDKVKFVKKEHDAKHKVIMIGDGINDAPALSAAEVGIAIDGCSSIAGETADIMLSEDGLASLVTVRYLGQGLLNKMYRNNQIIIGVNSLLLAGGIFGFINPALAALLHNSVTIGISVAAMRSVLSDDELATFEQEANMLCVESDVKTMKEDSKSDESEKNKKKAASKSKTVSKKKSASKPKADKK